MHSLIIIAVVVGVLTLIYHAKETWLDILVAAVSIGLVLYVVADNKTREGLRQIAAPMEQFSRSPR